MNPTHARPPIRRRPAPVIRQLDDAEVANAAERLKPAGVEAVAVCFLFSYRNRGHRTRPPGSASGS